MPQQPTIVWRVGNWLRNRISSPDDEGNERISEEHEQRRAEEVEHSQRRRVIEYNCWIERQRRIEHNLRLQRENQDELRNPRRGPFLYRPNCCKYRRVWRESVEVLSWTSKRAE
ncbi:hypothetical protein HO173_003988 [Letharia columbiana]|uniref:Uncharacterized protein n=1 Tax=Letharia columbiana TaxID=112416 RepID=A0A8H6L6X4_9LECA|nr:uncharacterized protein HO173_003988 [Letharia columbiana]KAF6237787.1 hypothetical protein HO173_003988 [Letharia columbiana]